MMLYRLQLRTFHRKKTGHHNFMSVSTEKNYDREVAMKIRSDQAAENSDDTPTSPDTDNEMELKREASAWSGCYIFSLSTPPERPARGWVAGKGISRDKNLQHGVQLLLTLPTNGLNGVRGKHFTFNFLTNTSFFGINRATKAPMELTVNGDPVSASSCPFNRSCSRVRIGYLEYIFNTPNMPAPSPLLIRNKITYALT